MIPRNQRKQTITSLVFPLINQDATTTITMQLRILHHNHNSQPDATSSEHNQNFLKHKNLVIQVSPFVSTLYLKDISQ